MSKLYCIGTGAGNGAYITLGALRALEKSDIIAVPVKRLGEKSTALEIIRREFDASSREIIELEFPMNRDSAVLADARKAASEKIAAKLAQGKTVSMITLGDVSIYSTCAYIRREIAAAGFETETIAGVPSFIAAACAAQISLCEGDEAAAIIPSARKSLIEKYIDDFDTLIIMKAGKNIDEIYNLLKSRGLENNAIVCSGVGMDGEIVEKIAPNTVYGYFTTVIIKKNMDKSDIK